MMLGSVAVSLTDPLLAGLCYHTMASLLRCAMDGGTRESKRP